jgi:hypothetical protein
MAWTAVTGVLMVVMLAGCAERPAQNIDPGRHPNLAAAQSYSAQAYDKVVAAQQANEWDMGGHAQRAKDILVQVNDELKQAALTANRRGH